MTLYGYYSDKQYEKNGIIYVYRNLDKQETFLTEVKDKLLTRDELTKYFEDNNFMGEVFEFIRIDKIDLSFKQFK
jgi:hypothetical protein